MWRGLGVCAVVLLVGCTGDEKIADDGSDAGPDRGGDDSDGGATDGGECADDSDCGTGRICEPDTCVDGDRNNSVDEAETLLFIDSSDESARTTATLNPAGDQDFYAIHADGGEFVRVTTYTDEEDETRDTVVSILRDNGKLVTYANGHAAGGGLSDADSVVYAYLPDEGTYYVLVEDDATFFGEGEEEGGRDYTYELALTEWTGHTSEPDAVDDPRAGISVSSANAWSARGAVLESTGDVDYVALSMEIDGHDLFVDGNYDLSGSEADPRVRLLDASSGEVLRDKRQNGLAGALWYPNLPSGEYMLELSDAAGGGSSDHWFYVHTLARAHESTYVWETESNDSDSTAEPLEHEPLSTDSGNEYTVARVEGLADFAGDEDWFEVTSEYDDGRFVVCLNSTWYGGTTAPTVELYDAGLALLGSVEGETDSAVNPTAALANLDVPTGTYYLRVQHPPDVGGSAGDWYRALVFVASFNVDSYACP